ncbi:MAG: PAS domain S-box protein [Sedimentisphaerales bacterium]|nr:PAS domain S-box protein [Sedimentisphaerales bacterium]
METDRILNTVYVPEAFRPVFEKAQDYVSRYFGLKKEDASKGTIEIYGEPYILVRAASMSVDFFGMVKNLYWNKGTEEAIHIARSVLFDIAHTIGKMDARNFHKKMNLRDPIEKLSAGPIHFSHSGWAFVNLSPESSPTPDEHYCLVYDHPFSFESDAWLRAKKTATFPVCVMNAGYSSGWCEESFGVSLVATEIMCKAQGDEACRFVMAHPSKIEQYIQDYLQKAPEIATKVTSYQIPGLYERKWMEDKLRESEANYQTIFNEVNDAIFVHDLCTGRILDVNERMCEMFGYPRIETLALNVGDISSGAPFYTEQDAVALIRKAVAKGPQVFEWQAKHKDGHLFWVEVNLKLAKIMGENRVLAVVRDITERKLAEEELEKLNTSMESANRELTRANRELQEFAYITAHDLKTPLRGIGTLANWISRDCADKFDKQDKEHVNLLVSRVQQMSDLIDDILQYSTLGRMKGKQHRVDLKALVSDVIAELDPPSHIRITFQDELPILICRRTHIKQAFHHLLCNAIKYIDKAEGQITIGCVEEEKCWKFRVTDNGPGIREKYFDKIFQMFQTLAPRDETGSTGIGLPIVKKIAEMNGGTAWVESEVGNGSTFFFTFAKQKCTTPIAH